MTNNAHNAKPSHGDVPLLLDFWAPWCGSCEKSNSALDAVEKKFAQSLRVVRLNVDDDPDTAMKHDVRHLPTFVLIKNGKEVDRKLGSMDHAAMEKWLTTIL